MSTAHEQMKQFWESSFAEQVDRSAYNTAPAESVIRTLAYYLRGRYADEELGDLHFTELGCGAGPNLLWLARKGVKVTGIDIAPTALELCRQTFAEAGLSDHLLDTIEAGASDVPLEDESVHGAIEANVFAHLPREERYAAFREVDRIVKPGGVFVGYMIEAGHTVWKQRRDEELPDDPGTLNLDSGGSKLYLTNVGTSHFFTKDEIRELLPGWSIVDPCLTAYEIPHEEAERRGYEGDYLQSMLTVYAVK